MTCSVVQAGRMTTGTEKAVIQTLKSILTRIRLPQHHQYHIKQPAHLINLRHVTINIRKSINTQIVQEEEIIAEIGSEANQGMIRAEAEETMTVDLKGEEATVGSNLRITADQREARVGVTKIGEIDDHLRLNQRHQTE